MRSDRRLDGLPGSGRLYSPSQCDSEQVVEVGDAGTEVTATVPDPTELVDQYPLLDDHLGRPVK